VLGAAITATPPHELRPGYPISRPILSVDIRDGARVWDKVPNYWSIILITPVEECSAEGRPDGVHNRSNVLNLSGNERDQSPRDDIRTCRKGAMVKPLAAVASASGNE